MSVDALERAFASTRAILANVNPDQLDGPTPCVSWDVRRLVNHIVGGSQWYAITEEAGAAPEDDQTEAGDFTKGDAAASFDQGIKASLAAFSAPGALEKTVKLPFGEFPGAAFLGLATIDTFTHGWDLARATGQSADLDPELAETLLEQSRAAVPDQFRGPDGVAPFGPAVEPPASATSADRLAAFLGRTV